MKMSRHQICDNDLIIVTGKDYSSTSNFAMAISNWVSSIPNLRNVRVTTNSVHTETEISVTILSTTSLDEIFEREVLR